MSRVTAAVIERDGRILIARRKVGDRFGGLWEFPGGKVEADELPEECLRRELQEELGVEAEVKEFLAASRYDYGDIDVELLAYRVDVLGEDFRLIDHDEIRWVLPEELKHYTFPEADAPIVSLLAEQARPATSSPPGRAPAIRLAQSE